MTSKKTKKKSEPKQKKEHVHPHPVAAFFYGVAVGVGILFLSVATYSSQMIHPLYSQLVTDNPQAWVSFFKVIRTDEALAAKVEQTLPEIQSKKTVLQAEIDKDNSTRREMISKLEEYLALNPQSRDVLYAISTLYKESGENEKAVEYLKKAQAVDPTLSL